LEIFEAAPLLCKSGARLFEGSVGFVKGRLLLEELGLEIRLADGKGVTHC
jgi:hypothetical protein